MGDHTFDYTADDFARPPMVELPPDVVQVAAWLSGMSPERRQVLAESQSEEGCPVWVHKRASEWGGWEDFRDMCLEALYYLHEHGVPVEASLLVSLQDAA